MDFSDGITLQHLKYCLLLLQPKREEPKLFFTLPMGQLGMAASEIHFKKMSNQHGTHSYCLYKIYVWNKSENMKVIVAIEKHEWNFRHVTRMCGDEAQIVIRFFYPRTRIFTSRSFFILAKTHKTSSSFNAHLATLPTECHLCNFTIPGKYIITKKQK